MTDLPRKIRYKLCVYHGYDDVQLFDLHNDPNETMDLGRDPDLAGVRETMLAEVGRQWDGEWIARRVRLRAEENELLFRRGGACHPAESERWEKRASLHPLLPSFTPLPQGQCWSNHLYGRALARQAGGATTAQMSLLQEAVVMPR